MLSTLIQLRRLQGTRVEVRTVTDTLVGAVISASVSSLWLEVDGDEVFVPLRIIIGVREATERTTPKAST
jgi:hypothetical protein